MTETTDALLRRIADAIDKIEYHVDPRPDAEKRREQRVILLWRLYHTGILSEEATLQAIANESEEN